MPAPPHVVFVVDDDKAVRNALKFLLEVEGMTVRTYDGPVALLGDQNLPPCACVVVDHHMPVMNGLELVTVLRNRGIAAPAILITGKVDDNLRAQANALEFHRVLEKPLSDSALVESITSAVAPSP